MMAADKVGRNDPCPCGSGKKYKKCCSGASVSARAAEYAHAVDLNRLGTVLKASGRPQISTMYQGKRVRAVGNRLYFRPPGETFHEFLLTLLAPIFGGEWYKAEYKKSMDQRHIVAQWYWHYCSWTRNTPRGPRVDGAWNAATDGPTQAIMQLAYDVYILQHCATLSKRMFKRLRDREAFQGARYEVAVAAIFARLGYAIQWEEDKQAARHCEFAAKNPRTGDVVAVEAKSRRRSGVLHEPVKYEGPVKMKGDIGALLKKALTQKPLGTPFVIFIDLNLPSTAHLQFKDKPWVADLEAVLNGLPLSTLGNPDPANAIVVTNFASYYGPPGGSAPAGEFVLLVSKCPKDPLKDARPLTELGGVLNGYGLIPDDERGGWGSSIGNPK